MMAATEQSALMPTTGIEKTNLSSSTSSMIPNASSPGKRHHGMSTAAIPSASSDKHSIKSLPIQGPVCESLQEKIEKQKAAAAKREAITQAHPSTEGMPSGHNPKTTTFARTPPQRSSPSYYHHLNGGHSDFDRGHFHEYNRPFDKRRYPLSPKYDHDHPSPPMAHDRRRPTPPNLFHSRYPSNKPVELTGKKDDPTKDADVKKSNEDSAISHAKKVISVETSQSVTDKSSRHFSKFSKQSSSARDRDGSSPHASMVEEKKEKSSSVAHPHKLDKNKEESTEEKNSTHSLVKTSIAKPSQNHSSTPAQQGKPTESEMKKDSKDSSSHPSPEESLKKLNKHDAHPYKHSYYSRPHYRDYEPDQERMHGRDHHHHHQHHTHRNRSSQQMWRETEQTPERSIPRHRKESTRKRDVFSKSADSPSSLTVEKTISDKEAQKESSPSTGTTPTVPEDEKIIPSAVDENLSSSLESLTLNTPLKTTDDNTSKKPSPLSYASIAALATSSSSSSSSSTSTSPTLSNDVNFTPTEIQPIEKTIDILKTEPTKEPIRRPPLEGKPSSESSKAFPLTTSKETHVVTKNAFKSSEGGYRDKRRSTGKETEIIESEKGRRGGKTSQKSSTPMGSATTDSSIPLTQQTDIIHGTEVKNVIQTTEANRPVIVYFDIETATGELIRLPFHKNDSYKAVAESFCKSTKGMEEYAESLAWLMEQHFLSESSIKDGRT